MMRTLRGPHPGCKTTQLWPVTAGGTGFHTLADLQKRMTAPSFWQWK
ncbi:hypothetical protein [Primorskyibacter sp. S187A]